MAIADLGYNGPWLQRTVVDSTSMCAMLKSKDAPELLSPVSRSVSISSMRRRRRLPTPRCRLRLPVLFAVHRRGSALAEPYPRHSAGRTHSPERYLLHERRDTAGLVPSPRPDPVGRRRRPNGQLVREKAHLRVGL